MLNNQYISLVCQESWKIRKKQVTRSRKWKKDRQYNEQKETELEDRQYNEQKEKELKDKQWSIKHHSENHTLSNTTEPHKKPKG